jgi:hypothetical protein
MTKNDKKQYKMLSEEDLKIIKADPAGLADYVVATKIKSARKSALIICLIGMIVAFGTGAVCGMTWTKSSIPNNVVQIHVGNDGAVEEGK